MAADPSPFLSSFQIDYDRLGPAAPLARSAEGQRMIAVITSRDAVAGVIGAIDAGRKRSPLPALGRYILQEFDRQALSDPMLQLAGRVLRQVIEHIGGVHVRAHSRIRVPSLWSSGSVYTWAAEVGTNEDDDEDDDA
jgi:hypothetical protein